MNSSEIIKKTVDFVQSTCGDVATGHDWFHIDRVRNNALYLQSKEGGDVLIIELAALLHDISDYKFNGGDEKLGGEVAHQAVMQCGGSEELAHQVKAIVNSVSYKGAHVADTTSSLEAKIVQDADRLDALGAIGIARTFAYGGKTGAPIYDPAIKPQLHTSFEAYKNSKSTTINHFYEKLLLLPDKMHTNTAKELAEERVAFMKKFLEQFYTEWNNKLK
ncbi:MAG: HD domain-containing protein [Crocinitomicaceae bacterium]|nr:HD domain-containing protein [Taishania sp.]